MARTAKRAIPVTFPRTGLSSRPLHNPMLTAHTQVNPTEEANSGLYDLYVCNPNINTATFQANQKPGALRLGYTAAAILLNFDDFWNDLEGEIFAVHGENAFWHDGVPAEGTRLELEPNAWLIRPSAAVGTTMANAVIEHLVPFFHGTMVDEMQENLPNQYWDIYKTNTDIVLTDADRPVWNANWKSMQSAYIGRLKTIWQDERVVIGNTAGAIYPWLDGITIEDSHITSNGINWALGQWRAQEALWRQSPYRWRSPGPLNVAWNAGIRLPNFVMDGYNDGA